MLIKTFNKILLGLFVLTLPGLAFAFIEFEEYSKTEFSPERNEKFEIPIKLTTKARVDIRFYTADGDLVRTLNGKKPLKKGGHKLIWDGKDNTGNVVPDEVYIPVIEAINEKGEKKIIDSRQTSGGEVDENLQVNITAGKHISYTLPAPSRVMIRAGIKGGPMMRSLANWAPRSAGKNIQRWDGMDQNRLLDLRQEGKLTLVVTAFRLPQYAIITLGNKKISYADYRKQKGWADRVVNPKDIILARGDVRIARQYYISPAQARDPRIELSMVGLDSNRTSKGLPVFKSGQQVQVKVEVDKKDRWLIDQSLYEVAFFIDHEFVSEEEQGYLPLTWRWAVNSVEPGQHIFTVNISGFDGKVSVVSQLFEIEK
jgi:hypothetical protein